MLSFLQIAAGGFAATYIFLLAALRLSQDAEEPPSICDTIPFITPVIDMVSKGVSFHRLMRDKYNFPIYTLRLPGLRLYVVNSPPLITAIQNQYRTLSFTALEGKVAVNVIGVNKAIGAVIERDVTSDDGYLMNFPKYIHSALAAGPGLDTMNRRSTQVISKSLDIRAQKGKTTINMFSWVRHELLMATTEGVYGPKNPFRDPAMEEAWYKFEPRLMTFVLNLFPRIFAREGLKAREYMVKAWERYFDEKSHKQGSDLVKARVRINDDFGIPIKETARLEIGGSQAILTNTLPGAFWLAYHIFSDAVVLRDVREELSKGVYTDTSGAHTIDLSHVKSSCPVLLSTFKETMRFHSTSAATRIAMKDCRLNNQYLLKQGSTIIMPSTVQHTNQDVWGNTVDEFMHKRFLHQPGVKGPNPIAFRGFGGGTTLCPGRHFASTEILMFSALLALRFDIHPLTGKWIRPPTKKSPMINGMPIPDWDFEVEMRPKDDGKPWNVSFSGHDKGIEIAAEDIDGAKSNSGH
ncbi:cytochrome P450 [Xylaria arbuscula]|nr:cytochrome P450 [Xylaria arbuscula]